MKDLIERTKLFGKQIELKGKMSNMDMMTWLGLYIEATELDPGISEVNVSSLIQCGFKSENDHDNYRNKRH